MEHYQGSLTGARYLVIANDLATRIACGEYREGEKVLGRSSLAGRYNVSPETIRRAVSLLEQTKIVQILPGVGVVVKSREAAEAYLARVEDHHLLQDIQNRLAALMQERLRLEAEINGLLEELLGYSFKMSSRLQKIHEIRIPPNSGLVGRDLAAVQFRARTGATVLAIQRNGVTTFSPPADTTFCAGDLLVYIGPPDVEVQVRQLVSEE
jgi:K+/H+ antiporter YhaU regulatory subunit KhtT